ncbi:hypothetical protein AMJ80_11350 [bacterium SM23_31]|nr:MAG: hypothetical protein AMJ80_11350 [bacterium SM23_31]
MKKYYPILLTGLLLITFVLSCGIIGKNMTNIPRKEPVPEYMEFFNIGKQAYEEGKLDEAVDALQRSLAINPDFVPAAEMLGFALLDLSDYDGALHQLSAVLTNNAYSVKARIGVGHIYLLKEDFQKAVDELDIAITVEPANADAYFYRGLALKQKGDEYLSTTSFVRAVIHDESYRATVAGLIPLTEPWVANLFKKEFLAIETKPSINRAELAALLVAIIRDQRVYSSTLQTTTFQPPQMYDMGRQVVTISDVPDDFWAKNEIYKAVNAGLIKLYPDQSFKPEQQVVKSEFASLLQALLMRILAEPDLAVKYIGEISPFNDLNSAHWAYNAARIVIEYNLLQPREPDYFGLDDPVSALTAIQAFELIKK